MCFSVSRYMSTSSISLHRCHPLHAAIPLQYEMRDDNEHSNSIVQRKIKKQEQSKHAPSPGNMFQAHNALNQITPD